MEKKYAVFTTNHFSIYAIAEDLGEPKNTIKIPNNVIENPQTFDNILNSILIGIVSFIALCGTIYFLLRNNKSKFKI
ncbi:unknown [Clostridium sp. CAG:762]|nr:unknown [Clostridium sp. CAG:762]